jgi:exonuclease III
LRVVTWNCNGAFRKKFASIEKFNADIYIIQECEDPSRVVKKPEGYESFSKGHLWTGDNKNKGLGVFVRNGVSIEKTELDQTWNELNLKWFLPFQTENKQKMLAVWSHRGESDEYRYIGQFWCFLQKHKENMRNTVIAGDFNSNTIWDYKRSECTHSNCVKDLKAIGIESLHHVIEGVAQGEETKHTFFLYKNKEKKYHIDYFFVPTNLLKQTKEFRIESFNEWMMFSDHVPLIWEYVDNP